MEVFVKVIAEDLKSGKRKIAATALLTFVALDENKRPTWVPEVIPETEEEKNYMKPLQSGQECVKKENKK